MHSDTQKSHPEAFGVSLVPKKSIKIPKRPLTGLWSQPSTQVSYPGGFGTGLAPKNASQGPL